MRVHTTYSKLKRKHTRKHNRNSRYHPANPVIVPDQEWEGTFAMPFSGGAFWQDNEGRIALWYRCGGGYALDNNKSELDGDSKRSGRVGDGAHQGPNTTGTCLAYSTDGVSTARNTPALYRTRLQFVSCSHWGQLCTKHTCIVTNMVAVDFWFEFSISLLIGNGAQ